MSAADVDLARSRLRVALGTEDIEGAWARVQDVYASTVMSLFEAVDHVVQVVTACEHSWHDVTEVQHADRHLICTTCRATKEEPR